MALSQAQIKGRIKNIAKSNKADARILIRIYMMERFLERIANSVYAENFILKGGILITSLVGVSMRSTMDIDTSIRGFTLSQEEVLRIVKEISEIDLEDGVTFSVKSVSGIMDEMDYPGIRLALDACMDVMVTPIKIDISTGDVITPEAVEYDYKLMLEERSIHVWSYNLETILAEKLQTVMSRGILNTRMRDYYDIYTLMLRYENDIGRDTLKQAFDATCKKRGTTDLTTQGAQIFDIVMNDRELHSLWNAYQKKFIYAGDIAFEAVMKKAINLYEIIR
jgi:predicted nucleotidyltransferase component of viral defense system